MNPDIIQVENKYYISVNSTYADDRTHVLNHIDTFGIFDRWGDIKQIGEEIQGIYCGGTRFVSDFEFRVNGNRPLLLSSSVKEENELLSVDLTNPMLYNLKTNATLSKGNIYIGRSKFIREGACYERISFYNYGSEYYEFETSFYLNADFKDIFEVRGIQREKRGEIYEVRHLPGNIVRIGYRGLDNVKRFTEAQFDRKPDSWEKHNKALFTIKLKPHQHVLLHYNLQFLTGSEQREKLHFKQARIALEKDQQASTGILANISTSNQQLNGWITRSDLDLKSLLADTPYGKYPYAGVPWYNTAFGRDGIITALQALWAAPDIARDVLLYLSKTQATKSDPYCDAEPGKIIHEVRTGEMARLKEVPFGKYYGSVDATPLYVVLAGAYYQRSGDLKTIKKIWPNIQAALDWIDKYGDTNGDGFTDYSNKSVNGLVNQGWKDSHDSISNENGELATPPIALCEVQGYVYDARVQAAKLAAVLGHDEKAEELAKAAAGLKRKFNKHFWDEQKQCYSIALDGNKKPCRIVSSNAGHCLYSGIADADKAVKTAATLLKEDMFAGWGIRTLSTREVRYNPMSYHNGSVWPHDNSIIAKGFSNYGLKDEMLKVMGGLFDASLFIELQRLPELFCGFDRRPGEGPTDYPVACSPQAWAVASVYLLLEACMGMEINASDKIVTFRKPVMPENVEWVKIERLQLGAQHANVELYCEEGQIKLKVKKCPKDWKIVLEN